MEPKFWPVLRFRENELKALRFSANSLLSAVHCLLNMESYGDYNFWTSWCHDKLEILKSLHKIRALPWVPRQSQQKRTKSLCDLAWVTEKSRMMVTIQLRRIINAYLGRSTKPVLNRILRLSNFRLQNSSNFNAAIQIFLWLHEPNYPIFYSYVKFRLLVTQLIFVLERDDLYLQGFLPPTSDNKPLKFSATERYTTDGIIWNASFSTHWNKRYVVVTCISFFCQKNLCLANNGNPFLQTID